MSKWRINITIHKNGLGYFNGDDGKRTRQNDYYLEIITMKPKEKAKKLVDVYRNTIMLFLSDDMKDRNVIRCTLIAVEEVLNKDGYNNDYWQEVKQEIENLL